jgi:hypothetical protein
MQYTAAELGWEDMSHLDTLARSIGVAATVVVNLLMCYKRR